LAPDQSIARLVEQLKRQAIRPKKAPDRVALYMMDVTNGEVTLIADQPAPGLTQCGSPAWSHDGRRILFDATPGTQWSLTRLQSIDLGAERPTPSDLGTGNCPTFSPSDDRIAFLSNADGVQTGVWLMKADGTDRRLLGDYGKPMWSPDTRQLMIMSFESPRQVTLMDVNPDKSGVLRIPDHQIWSDPSWAGKGTIVAVVGLAEGDTVALIDVADPPQSQIKAVLWRRSNGPDVKPTYPVYSAITGRCIFVGGGEKGVALFSVEQGKAGPARQLGPRGYEPQITGIGLSPDGRYVLYSVHGAGRAQGGLAAAGAALAVADRAATVPASRARKDRIYITGQSRDGRGISLIAIDPESREHSVALSDCSMRARVSPDGLRVAYEKNDAVWVCGLDKAEEPHRVTDLGGATAGSPAVWSPDGKELIISLGRRDEGRRIWVHTTVRVSADGADPKELSLPTEDNVQDWSADGQWLLTASSRGAKLGWQLYVMRPDGTDERRITDGGNPFYARFSPDGRRVVYTDNARKDQSGIWLVGVDGKNPRRVLPIARDTIGSACWSPDGKRIAVAVGPMNPKTEPGTNPPTASVIVVDLDTGGQSKIVMPQSARTDMPDWR
jgi:Tol biopolymer transport system component